MPVFNGPAVRCRQAIGKCLLSVLIFFSLASCGRDEAGPVTDVAVTRPLILYSSLPEETVRSITTAYTDASGIAMHYLLESAPALIEKLRSKAHRPAADVLLISGAGQLAAAVGKDVLRPTYSESMRQRIPAAQRDPDGYWFGLSARAVAIVYDKRLVDATQLGAYKDLQDEAWQGRLCSLTSEHEVSRTLVASLIASLGDRDAEFVVRNWKKNSAGSVLASGREVLLAIENSRCQVGFVGSDAIAEQREKGGTDHVAVHWPAATDGGALLSITGAGVSRHAASPERAVNFLEWLAAADGQSLLVTSGRDLPLNPSSGGPEMVVSPIESARLGYLLPDAIRLMERARYR